MFDALKRTLLDGAKDAVRSYNEGRHAMDDRERKAFDHLGLPYDSSLESIKARYKELSKAYHPDAGGADKSAMFLKLKEAYDVLRTTRRKGKVDE